jgi:hypothetical protein
MLVNPERSRRVRCRMRRVWIATALVVGALACASAKRPAPAPAPTPPLHGTKVDLLAPAVDLSGGWTTGRGSEPPPGPVAHHPSCAYNPAVWIIQQSGNTLKAWVMPESFNQGIARAGPGPEKGAGSPGTISGADVVIDDGQDRFVLRYDRDSGHLRGTRNGAPFWAARQMIVRTEACPGIP